MCPDRRPAIGTPYAEAEGGATADQRRWCASLIPSPFHSFQDTKPARYPQTHTIPDMCKPASTDEPAARGWRGGFINADCVLAGTYIVSAATQYVLHNPTMNTTHLWPRAVPLIRHPSDGRERESSRLYTASSFWPLNVRIAAHESSSCKIDITEPETAKPHPSLPRD